jgi:hypothetical protein
VNLLVMSTHLQHRCEKIFRVSCVSAPTFSSCDTPSLRGDDLIRLSNFCGNEGKFIHELAATAPANRRSGGSANSSLSHRRPGGVAADDALV